MRIGYDEVNILTTIKFKCKKIYSSSRKENMKDYLLTGKAICAVLWKRVAEVIKPITVCGGGILLIALFWWMGTLVVRYFLPTYPGTPAWIKTFSLLVLGAIVGFMIFYLLFILLILNLTLYRGMQKCVRWIKRNATIFNEEITETKLVLVQQEEKKAAQNGAVSLAYNGNGTLELANGSRGSLELAKNDGAQR